MGRPDQRFTGKGQAVNRNRVFVYGCLGAIVLIAALVGILDYSARRPYEEARARWDAKGSGDYSLVVTENFHGGSGGEYMITVKSGRVTGFEAGTGPVGWDGWSGKRSTIPPEPADFEQMTVATMLDQAGRDQRDAWAAPWVRDLSIDYDPVYGYVTDYYSDPNGRIYYLFHWKIPEAGYWYTAHDLVLTGSAP